MSGPLSVPFVFAALFWGGPLLKALFGVLAVVCAFTAAFMIWRKEHRRVLALEQRFSGHEFQHELHRLLPLLASEIERLLENWANHPERRYLDLVLNHIQAHKKEDECLPLLGALQDLSIAYRRVGAYQQPTETGARSLMLRFGRPSYDSEGRTALAAVQATIMGERLSIAIRDVGQHVIVQSAGTSFVVFGCVSIASLMKQRRCDLKIRLGIKQSAGEWLPLRDAVRLPDQALSALRSRPEVSLSQSRMDVVFSIAPGEAKSGGHVSFSVNEQEWVSLQGPRGLEFLKRGHLNIDVQDIFTGESQKMDIECDWSEWFLLRE